VAVLVLAGALLAGGLPSTVAQAQTPAPAAAAASGPVMLEVAPGTRASYRAQEQLAGINFPNEAVGMTETVTGTIRIAADGSIDSTQSKLTIDLRTLKSDQDNRDNYLRTRTFETEKFPMAEFVPRRIQGVPSPLPATGQAGFQLVGDMTIHGVTSEVTWNGVATFVGQMVAGRATTSVNFAKFNLPKPQLARVVSVEDNIRLEIDFRLRRGS
jgi:polyisoprenoid-binding protein YceI